MGAGSPVWPPGLTMAKIVGISLMIGEWIISDFWLFAVTNKAALHECAWLLGHLYKRWLLEGGSLDHILCIFIFTKYC
jgi:hypothetical protein